MVVPELSEPAEGLLVTLGYKKISLLLCSFGILDEWTILSKFQILLLSKHGYIEL